jgi:site-specific recombinase XerD
MTNEAISPLRRRMIEDMTIRRLSPNSQQGYIRTIKNLAAFIGRSPDKASFEDVRRFQLHVARSGVATGARNATVAALRFFFRVTLGRRDITEHTAFIHEPRKLPVVLSPDEMARLLDAAPGLKYRAALSVAYGAGLRACEVVALKISDIDSKRMLIRVEQGKGRKDRYVMLSHISSTCCAPGARRAGHRGGCSPVRTLSILSPRASSIVPAMQQPRWRGSTSGYLRTRSGTALPPTCSSRTSTSA